MAYEMNSVNHWKGLLNSTDRYCTKKQLLKCFQKSEKYIDSLLDAIQTNLGYKARNDFENAWDYEIALVRTYATGRVYDSNNNNIFE